MKFNELNLTSDLMRGIEEADFTDCTPVQERTFELVLNEGRDAIVQSQTGTGKTAAFLISIFEIFERRKAEGGNQHAALVVVPTRELAVQVADEAKLLGNHLSYTIGSVFGGVGYGQQERLLEKGADIIIGTPGRLLDFSSSRKLDLRKFDILVLDEADRMLDMGFLPDVRKILRALPPVSERRTLLFSATLSSRVKHLAWEYMNDPGEIEVAPENVTVEEISQELYHVTRAEKLKLLLGLLERENPDNALIFTNMKSTAVELAKRLSANNLPSEYIMGDLPQRQRQHLINGIKEGKIKLLVATDVAARGLHIDDLDLVVNYDIPEDYELYVHRIGRTARAGKTGKAITLACERYVYGLEAIENFIGQKIPVVWPEESLFKEDASAGMRFSDQRRGRGGSDNRRSNNRSQRSPQSRKPSRGGNRSKPAGKPSGSPSEKQGTRTSQSRERTPSGRPSNQNQPRGEKAARGQQSRSRNAGATPPKPTAKASMEDRLSYYREKYGEDFQVNREKSDQPSGGGSRQPRKKRSPNSKGQGSRPPQGKRPSTAQKSPKQKSSAPNAPAKSSAPSKKPAQAPPAQQAPQGANPGIVGKLKKLFGRK